MGRAFDTEMAQVAGTIEWVHDQDTALLGQAFAHFRDRSLFATGSGGSLTAAAFAADLHFRTTGHASLAVTPLEAANFPDSMASSGATLLLSAEGKNKDILAAARSAGLWGVPSVALTLTPSNPLVQYCKSSGAATVVAYDMTWGKDGYLATNTLLGSMCLIWKAVDGQAFAQNAAALLEWFAELRSRLTGYGAAGTAPSEQLIVLFSNSGRVGGLDIESKMAEAAFAFVQACDYRQFAHGRHLQLANPAGRNPLVIALIDPDDSLGSATLELLPPGIATLPIELPPGPLQAKQVAGVLAAFALTERWGQLLGRDPGQPDVPQFARELHAMDPAAHVAPAAPPHNSSLRRKWREDAAGQQGSLSRFVDRLAAARFRALVCDFDGTFCNTIERYDGLPPELVSEIARLTDAGVHIAFATGRGDSLADDLRDKLPPRSWPQVTLGLLSGSWIFNLSDTSARAPAPDARLIALMDSLKAQRLLPERFQPRLAGSQAGLRGLHLGDRERVRHVLSERFREARFEGWRVLSSGHSLDVLTESASKIKVLEYVSRTLQVDPLTEILRLGDAGDHGGNDFELLSEGLGLSIDMCHGLEDSCWNLLPSGRRGVAGTLYLLQALETDNGRCSFATEAVHAFRATEGQRW